MMAAKLLGLPHVSRDCRHVWGLYPDHEGGSSPFAGRKNRLSAFHRFLLAEHAPHTGELRPHKSVNAVGVALAQEASLATRENSAEPAGNRRVASRKRLFHNRREARRKAELRRIEARVHHWIRGELRDDAGRSVHQQHTPYLGRDADADPRQR
jgi:hypothetical protein